MLDIATFNTWIEARNEGRDDSPRSTSRFSPEFKDALGAWSAPEQSLLNRRG